MRAKEIIERMTHGTHLTFVESIVVPEVGAAFNDWVKNAPKGDYVFIGGNVVGYYSKPRATMDVDVLFKGNNTPTEVAGFKLIRPHAFQHNNTHVEVEVLSAGFLGIPTELVQKVFDTAVEINGVHLPSVEGLVALKLMRGSMRDLGDIEAIIEKHNINLINWPVPQDKLQRAEQLLNVKLTEPS